MPYKIKITPSAFKGLEKAIEYYNAEQKGLGKRFHVSIKTIFTQLVKVPAQPRVLLCMIL